VEANLKAAETSTGVGQIINIANGQQVTLNQLLDRLKLLTGNETVVADYREPRAGDVRHSLADISRARDLLGFKPKVDLQTGLQLTIDWWKSSRFAAR
jgi:UDP-N-acetylglucosamine/UDP-N-acetyl-alpha-D-glucosaminouronate 4-epimerase